MPFPPRTNFKGIGFCDGIMPLVRFAVKRKDLFLDEVYVADFMLNSRSFRPTTGQRLEEWMKILSLLFTFVLLASAQEILTNDSIVKMVKGGLGDDLILTVIQKQPGKYSLSPDDLLKLKQQGVSEK